MDTEKVSKLTIANLEQKIAILLLDAQRMTEIIRSNENDQINELQMIYDDSSSVRDV